MRISVIKPDISGSGVGFTAVLLLMVIVFVIDFTQMAAVRQDISLILDQQHQKAELVSEMRFSIQKRQILLRNLALAVRFLSVLLKIDSHLVNSMVTSNLYKSIVDSVNRIGQERGIKIIAVSAETENALELLAEIGVEYAQGNIVGSPKLLFKYPENIKRDTQPEEDTLQATRL